MSATVLARYPRSSIAAARPSSSRCRNGWMSVGPVGVDELPVEVASPATVAATSPPWCQPLPALGTRRYPTKIVVRRSTTRRRWEYTAMGTVETPAASSAPAITLPPGPRIPKALQGMTFGFFRRRFVHQVGRRYGGVFSLHVP